METLLPIFERLGAGIGFGLVCMYFYRQDVVQGRSQLVMLLQECMTVIKENSQIISAHNQLLQQYLSEEKEDKRKLNA